MRRNMSLKTGSLIALGFPLLACSLNLDEKLIDEAPQRSNGGTGGSASGGGSANEGGNSQSSAGSGGAGQNTSGGNGGVSQGGSAGSSLVATECEVNEDCAAPNACVAARCSRGECVYDTCPATECRSRSCGSETSCVENTSSHGFLAAKIELGEEIGCGGVVSNCIAATDSWVFAVGNTRGLMGWDISEPSAPKPLTIEQPPFAIARLASHEGRILLWGHLAGGQQSVGWLDRSPEAGKTNLKVQSRALLSTLNLASLLPGNKKSFIGVGSSLIEPASTTLLELPTENLSQLELFDVPEGTFASSDIKAQTRIVASSGSRAIAFRTKQADGLNSAVDTVPTFRFLHNPGTRNVAASAENALSLAHDISSSHNTHRFASHSSGRIAWAGSVITPGELVLDPTPGKEAGGIQLLDGGPIQIGDGGVIPVTLPEATSVFLRILVDNHTSEAFNDSESQSFTLVEYPSGKKPATILAGPLAFISENQLITSTVPSELALKPNASVQIVSQTNDGSFAIQNQAILPTTISSLGIAAGHQLAYALYLEESPSGADHGVVQVFAPGCANPE